MNVDLSKEGDRFRAREVIGAVLKPWTISRSYDEIAAIFDAHDVCWGRYQTFRELVEEDPRCSTDNPMFEEVEQPGIGTYLVPGSPLDFGDVERLPPRRAPAARRAHRRGALGAARARRRRDRAPVRPGGRRRAGGSRGRLSWIVDFSDGSREMRELLGGKGAGIAEMTRVLGAERVPAGFTITTEACVAYLRDGAAPGGARGARSTRRSNGSSAPPPSGSATAATRCWSRCARARRVSMPGMLDTVLNLGLSDEAVEGLARADRRRPLRLGLLPAAAADVRQRRPRPAVERLRGRAGRGARRRRRERRHRARPPRTLRALCERFKQIIADAGDPLPAGPARAAARGDRRRVRVLERRAGARLPPARAASPTTGAPRSTCSGWRSATAGATSGLGRRVLAQRDHRRARALRRLPRQRAGRGRGRRDPQHRGARRPRATGCPRCTPSCSTCSGRSSATTATCRTSSSRSRTGRCSCSRRGRRSARPRPRCASPAMPSPRGCSTARRRSRRSTPTRSSALLHPTFDPDGEYRRAGPRRPGLARRRPGSDRLHRGGGRAARGRRRGRDPRPALHRGRGRRRLSRRPRHPHRRGRQVLARGAGRPRDGQAVRCRRLGARGRRRRGSGQGGRDGAPRRRSDRDRRLQRAGHRRRGRADRAPDQRRVRAGARAGPTRSAGSGCAQMPTPPRTQHGHARSAPRGSASAGPSTCSSARIARSWCARCSSRARAGGGRRLATRRAAVLERTETAFRASARPPR